MTQNYEIPKNLKYEYIFVFKNNITNKISDFATNKKSFVINNYFDIVEYRLKLENEIIIKSNKIISKFWYINELILIIFILKIKYEKKQKCFIGNIWIFN